MQSSTAQALLPTVDENPVSLPCYRKLEHKFKISQDACSDGEDESFSSSM